MTQGYGGNLTCQLLTGNTFQQTSKVDSTILEIHVTMPISNGDSVRCGMSSSMDFPLLKPWTHPFVVEWVCSLNASNRSDQKAMQACCNKIITGWGRGEANVSKHKDPSPPMYSNTRIIYSQKISTAKFRVTADQKGRGKRSKLIGQHQYYDPRIFNYSTSVGNFTAQLAMLLRAPAGNLLDYGVMQNHNSTHSLSQFIGECLINKTLSDPSTPPPSFADTQHALSMFYTCIIRIVLSLNWDTIFVAPGNVQKSAVGQLESILPGCRWTW